MVALLLCWESEAWNDYLYWQQTDKNVVKRINELIKDCTRQPFSGLGKPEPLKGELRGYWSRRITEEHRLVYKINETQIIIVQCRFHY